MKIHLCFILSLLLLITGCATPSPLMRVVEKGDINGVKALLDQGADVNESFYGATALTYASYYGPIEIVKMLLDRGADVDTVNRPAAGGWTALSSAASERHADIVKLLLDIGADIDKAIWELRGNTNTQAKDAVVFLKEFKQQRIARKPVTVISKPSREVLPAIKSDVDELPAMQAKPNKNAYAIVIGVEKYRQKLPKADFADNDARIMAEYLTKVMGYPEENIVMLINDRALKSDMEKYFEKWLSNNVEKESTVFVYYSGHGAPNPKTGDAYLVPYDGDPSFIEETGYPLKRLYAKLDKLPAREIIVVLDSCFSGAGGRSVLAKGARPLVMNMDKQVFYSDRIAILTASAGNQISSTYDEKAHGLFTYFLLKGIKNEDVVKPDGSIAISDLFSYLKPQVEHIARKQYNNEQTPQLIGAKKD
ncbi:MAG: ankyrin repeat domain-containing protein [Proteobacteria bacterium]|nr:ankyrin repeat domain-containing protein [Pseudomonadota bacterium]MBU4259464.1 ankyrin repeat domain-containing protein [Pseudomonadota bacterium]MBU4289141.1 ankyrin repeat domain-containing protein [Pseudomonadota bacterium]